MSFQLPVYHAPDFSHLTGAPDARFAPAPKDGVAPVGFHSTSMYPEYFKIGGKWTLAPESRMDCSVRTGRSTSSRTAAYARATAS